MPRIKSLPVKSAPLNGKAFVRLMLINGIAGAVLGLVFVAGVLALDVAGIRTMLARAGEWLVPLGLFGMGSVVTFASVAMGGAIMLIPKDDASDPPNRGMRDLQPVPVRVAHRARPRPSAD